MRFPSLRRVPRAIIRRELFIVILELYFRIERGSFSVGGVRAIRAD